MKKMTRRDFLKVCGVGAGIMSVHVVSSGPENALGWLQTFAAGVQTRLGNTLIRGTSDGRVFASKDEGKTWALLVNLGSENAVEALVTTMDNHLLARVQHRGHVFWLRSSDGQRWMNHA